MRLFIDRLIAISLALSLLGMPLIAARAGHGFHGPALAGPHHDHDAHSRQPGHGIPHDQGLDAARCALACVGLLPRLPVSAT